MTNLNMITRVAQAIAQSRGDTNWKAYESAARAAAIAMREPSNEMLEAALFDLPDWGDLPDDWRAMINYVVEESLQ